MLSPTSTSSSVPMPHSTDTSTLTQTRYKPKRPKLRYLTWPQYFQTILSYRHMLTPLAIILSQFFVQAFGEMMMCLYGRYWMISSLVHQPNPSRNILNEVLLMGMTGFLLIVGVVWIGGLALEWHVARKEKEREARAKKNDDEESGKKGGTRRKGRSTSTSPQKSTSPVTAHQYSTFIKWFIFQENKFVHMCVVSALILIGVATRLSLYFLQNDSLMRTFASSVCCIAFLLVFMLSMVYKGLGPKSKPSDESLMYSIGLSIALMVVIFWKTVGSTLDWSIHGVWAQLVLWIEALIVVVYLVLLLWVYYWRQYVRKNHMVTDVGDTYFEAIIEQEKESMKPWRIYGLCIGVVGNFLLLYMTFGSPAVISRWVRGNYSASVLFQTLAFGVFVFLMAFKPKSVGYLRPVTLRLLNVIFGGICVALAFRSQFVNYHYAFGIQQLLVYIMHFMSPIFLLNLQLIYHELLRSKEKVSIPRIAGGFFVAVSVFIVLVICSALSVVSSYLEPRWISRIVFGQHDITFTIMVVVTLLPSFFIRTNSLIYFNNGVDDIYRGDGRKNFKLRLFAFLIALVVGLGTIAVLVWTTPVKYYLSRPPKMMSPQLNIGVYNVRSGFDRKGLLNFEQHTEAIKALDLDIVSLMESDTCRIANGNSDFLRYAANSLAMYSYYGPKPTEGTLGVSFLSRFPIVRRRTKTIVTSARGEKTAIIVSKLLVSRKRKISLIIAHFGNANFREQLEQLSQELRRITLNQLSLHEGCILMTEFVPPMETQDNRRAQVEAVVSEFGLLRVRTAQHVSDALHSHTMRAEIFVSSDTFQLGGAGMGSVLNATYVPLEEVNDVQTLRATVQFAPMSGSRPNHG